MSKASELLKAVNEIKFKKLGLSMKLSKKVQARIAKYLSDLKQEITKKTVQDAMHTLDILT